MLGARVGQPRRPVGCELGQGFRGREGGHGAERGSSCGRCECLV